MLAIVCHDEEFTIKADELENKEWIWNYFVWRESEIMRIFSTQCFFFSFFFLFSCLSLCV